MVKMLFLKHRKDFQHKNRRSQLEHIKKTIKKL